MQTIPIKVWNRIDMLQQPIAAVAPASASGRKRWIAIYYDISRHSIIVHPPHLYCVIDTEFDVALLEIYAEHQDEDLAIVNQAKYYATDIKDLYAVLAALQVAPETFNAPWQVEHPLF